MSNIVETSCKRCKKPIATLVKSFYGCDKLQKQFGGICSDCISPEERQDLLTKMGMAIADNLRGMRR